jgi:tetratricopeptide (TPR) repeat protein
MRNKIYKFFKDKNTGRKDTLLFYFSGHGIPDGSGDTYLSTSEINSADPDENGFSFDELTKVMGKSNSKRIITILDCCYSGRARVAKGGNEKIVAKIAKEVMLETFEEKKRKPDSNLGEGKCLMASSLAHQESVMLKKLGHSLFTYYLLEGLKGGDGQSVDEEGHVTPNLLGDYIDEQIMSLPSDKRPDQRPLMKTETSGKFILADHPEFVKRPPAVGPSAVDVSEIIEEGRQCLEDKDFDQAIKLFDEAIAANRKNHVAYNCKGDVLFTLEKYEEAIKCYDEALKIKPNYFDVLKDKGLAHCKLKDYKRAIDCYDEALLLKPNHDQILEYKKEALRSLEEIDELKKGISFYDSDKYEEAIERFNRSLEANPKNADTLYYKGLALSDSSKYKEAIECYDEALKIKPTYNEAMKAKEVALKSQSEKDATQELHATKNETIVFVSYIREDHEAAKRLCLDLKNANLNLKPWIDTEILAGQRWDTEIKKAMQKSRYFIPLISSRAVEKIEKKGYTRDELQYAVDVLKETQRTHKIIIIPVRLNDCKIPFSQLEKIQYVDLFPDWKKGFEKLLKGIKLGNNLAYPSTTISPRTSSATGIISWDKALDKKVKSSDNQDIGKVQSITNEYIQTKEGMLSKNYYFISKYYFQGYDGDSLWVSLSKDEIKAKFDKEKEPEPGELQTPEYAERRTAITKQYPDFDSNIPQI